MWTVSTAKTHLSEILEKAKEDVQFVSDHGKVQVAIVNIQTYQEMLKKLEEIAEFKKKARRLKDIEALVEFQEAIQDEDGPDPSFERTPSRPVPKGES